MSFIDALIEMLETIIQIIFEINDMFFMYSKNCI